MKPSSVFPSRFSRELCVDGTSVGSSVPDAPVKEPETEPVPETAPPPPAREPEPAPFDPEWPEDRPEPQPKA